MNKKEKGQVIVLIMLGVIWFITGESMIEPIIFVVGMIFQIVDNRHGAKVRQKVGKNRKTERQKFNKSYTENPQ